MLVSAIMPTMNRRHLVPLALKSFLSQDWPEKEFPLRKDWKPEKGTFYGGIREEVPGCPR